MINKKYQQVKETFLRNKILFTNFSYLSILKFLEYVFPLITIPYLTRTLGVARFGLIAFATSFIGYFLLFVDFGFNLSATQEISVNRKNPQKIAEIFWTVTSLKAILTVVSFIILTAIVFSFTKFSRDYTLYLFTFGTVLASLLFPVWFFQGIQMMKYITVVQVVSRSIFVLLMFFLIKNPQDYLKVPLLTAMGGIVGGCVSLGIVFGKFKLPWVKPTLALMTGEFKNSYHIFIANASISLYTISSTFILGLFANDTAVGYYAGGEKIIRAAQNILSPIAQTVYPHVSELVSESKERAIAFLAKLTRWTGLFTLLLSTGLFIFASFISDILLGPDFRPSVAVIRILSLLPFMIGLSNVFGIQVMLNFNMKKEFTKIIVIYSLIHLVLIFILVGFAEKGVSLAVLITETMITLTMFIVLKRKKINLLPF